MRVILYTLIDNIPQQDPKAASSQQDKDEDVIRSSIRKIASGSEGASTCKRKDA